jgi:GNAT superfamily N-acetyltransferase
MIVPRSGRTPVLLRCLTPADAGAVTRIHFEAVMAKGHTHYAPHQLDAWTKLCRPDYRLAQIHYRLAMPGRFLVLAESAGRPMGYAWLEQRAMQQGRPDAAYLESLYVAPEAMGQGVGRVLLAAVEARAMADGAVAVGLDSSLMSTRFYRRQGYDEGPLNRYRMGGGVWVSFRWMTKRLNASAA